MRVVWMDGLVDWLPGPSKRATRGPVVVDIRALEHGEWFLGFLCVDSIGGIL